jgi:dihydropteroate synthase
MRKNKFCTKNSLNLNGRLLNIEKPLVMGILNITENSFFDGNKYISETDILEQTEKMLHEGADIIDIGANSTKPGAKAIDEKIEIEKITNTVKLILKQFPQTIISVDTSRAKVALKGVQEGALIINDVSGGEMDPYMFETVAKCNVPYILMHMRGTPETMQNLTNYTNLVIEMMQYFNQKIVKLQALGVKDIIIDPGFGFAKTIEQNFELLSRLDEFHELNKTILVGLSRKSTIYKTLNTDPENALNGTTVLNTIALQQGASILRVHDVKEALECIKLVSKTFPS